jgi:hypothetical protein
MDEIIREIETIDVPPILDAYYKIENGLVWKEESHGLKQSGLQYATGQDPFLSATGKVKLLDSAYDNLNTYFEGSIFVDLIKKYNLKRSRLIWAPPRSAYSFHKDVSPRVHIPLVTNPGCYFIFENYMKHIPAGSVYWVDTARFHTFINTSIYPRLHFIGSVSH